MFGQEGMLWIRCSGGMIRCGEEDRVVTHVTGWMEISMAFRFDIFIDNVFAS